MSKRTTIKRYLLIIERINNVSKPNLKDFLHHFNIKGIKCSVRTFNRDLEALRDEFGLEIVYNKSGKHYYIDESKSLNQKSFYRFLEMAELAELLKDNAKKGKNIWNYISFEAENTNTRGKELLSHILPVILEHKEISFIHENFQSGKESRKEFYPYFLKEYNYRWYVVGYLKNTEDLRIYGLDRIKDLEISNNKYEVKKGFNGKALFENVIGLAFNYSKLTEVKLWFNTEQCKYAQSQPFHHSQQVVKKDEDGCIVTLYVHPNVELRLMVVKHGANIKVLEPKWLADEVAEIHKQAADLYKT